MYDFNYRFETSTRTRRPVDHDEIMVTYNQKGCVASIQIWNMREVQSSKSRENDPYASIDAPASFFKNHVYYLILSEQETDEFSEFIESMNMSISFGTGPKTWDQYLPIFLSIDKDEYAAIIELRGYKLKPIKKEEIADVYYFA